MKIGLGDKSAFPRECVSVPGMTLRQHYIGCALMGLLANTSLLDWVVGHVKIEGHERVVNAIVISQVDDLLALMEEEQA